MQRRLAEGMVAEQCWPVAASEATRLQPPRTYLYARFDLDVGARNEYVWGCPRTHSETGIVA
eukprot:6209141-Pleurochrysis_carterae.AAC.1